METTPDLALGSSADLDAAAARFERALSRLEAGLADAVAKVADLARGAGHEEGWQAGVAAGREAALQDHGAVQTGSGEPDTALILREELAVARARETALEAAVEEARASLDDAIDDIRAALGGV
jgi:hypothetical protein